VKLLLDSCMWPGSVAELRAAGHDVVWVGEWPHDPGDEQILAIAAAERRVLVTLDNDFGELVVVRQQASAGVIRVIDESVWLHAPMCERAIEQYREELTSGAIVVVEADRTRVWLPDRDA
jgi:predicted nuclease of predicted toxin-antitoxin system